MELISTIKSYPLYSILATLFVAGFGYLLKISLLQRQSVKDAGKNIIAAFQEDLDKLIQTNGDCRLILNSEAFKKHESAIRNNINNPSFFKKFRLRHAWGRLAYYEGSKGIPFYEMYADYGSLDKRARMKTLAISRMQRIVAIVN